MHWGCDEMAETDRRVVSESLSLIMRFPIVIDVFN